MIGIKKKLILSTKFTPQIASDSENAVEEMLQSSFERLGTDYIDIYWIHNPADVEKWTPKLIPLLQSGKVKQVGVSNHNLEQGALTGRYNTENPLPEGSGRGVTNTKHIEEAVGAAKIVLTEEEIRQLENLAENTAVDTKGAWEAPMI